MPHPASSAVAPTPAPTAWPSAIERGGQRRVRRLAVPLAGLSLVALAGCQSGIGPDPERPRATIRAYETRVADLRREVDDQRATFAALTPPPPTPTPVPFAARWDVELAGPPALTDRVGINDGITPVAANGSFLVVPIAVTNLLPRPAAFDPTRLRVVDGEERSFDLDPRATGAAYLLDFGYEPSFAPRQPNIVYPEVLVFDVAPDAGAFVLTSVDSSVSVPLPPPVPATPSP